MQTIVSRLVRTSLMVLATFFSLSFPAHGQNTLSPHVIPQIKPLVKLVGFINTTPAPTNVLPVVTLKLPGNEKRHTFLVTEMKVMAGPLRTAESILAEVKPYTPSFHVRTSREIATQIAEATPIERLTILAEYSSSDRALMIQGFEKAEDNKE